MLRLVFASVSILALANCDALWSSYEVPCSHGFSCPDGGISTSEDLAGQGTDRDGSTGTDDASTPSDDGPTGSSDMGDMRVNPITDILTPTDILKPTDILTAPTDILMPLDMLTVSDMLTLPDLPDKNDGGVIVKDGGVIDVSDLGLAAKDDPPARRSRSRSHSHSQGHALVPAGRAKR